MEVPLELKNATVRVCRDVRDGQCINPTHRADTKAILWVFSTFDIEGPGGVTISLVIRTAAGKEIYRFGPAPLARGARLPPRQLPAPFAAGRYVVRLEGEYVRSSTSREPIPDLPEWELTITAGREN